MIKFFKAIAQKSKKNLKIEKSVSGEWMVKKGFKVLCVGTREKCDIYIGQIEVA